MRKIIRAGLAGGCATTTDVTVLTTLVHHGAPIALSAFAGAACGAIVCFLMNKYVTFRDRTPVRVGQVARFAMVASCTALFTALAMQVLAVGIGIPYLLAKAMCAVLVFSCWSYPAQKRVVFRCCETSRRPRPPRSPSRLARLASPRGLARLAPPARSPRLASPLLDRPLRAGRRPVCPRPTPSPCPASSTCQS